MNRLKQMVTSRCFLAIGLSVILSGCATKYEVLTPEVQANMMADLQAGKLVLDCGSKCSFTWISEVDSINTLDSAERWSELAQRVMQIGFGQDLAYYYLGQAAQGLGYHQAAITYYNWSYALAVGQNHGFQCEALRSDTHDSCEGVEIASAAPVLIQASKDALAQQATASSSPVRRVVRRTRVVKPTTTAGGPAQPAGATADGWAMPPPASK